MASFKSSYVAALFLLLIHPFLEQIQHDLLSVSVVIQGGDRGTGVAFGFVHGEVEWLGRHVSDFLAIHLDLHEEICEIRRGARLARVPHFVELESHKCLRNDHTLAVYRDASVGNDIFCPPSGSKTQPRQHLSHISLLKKCDRFMTIHLAKPLTILADFGFLVLLLIAPPALRCNRKV